MRVTRFIRGLLERTLLALLILGGVGYAAGWFDGPRPRSPSTPRITTPAPKVTHTQLVEAVRGHLRGKVIRTRKPGRPTWRVCTQLDVDRDRHARYNPELARCPRVGHRYRVDGRPREVREPCPQIPAGAYVRVERIATGWRVTYGGRVWRVRRAPRGGLSVEANQAC